MTSPGYSLDKVPGQVLYLEGMWNNDQLFEGVGRVRYVNGDWCVAVAVPKFFPLKVHGLIQCSSGMRAASAMLRGTVWASCFMLMAAYLAGNGTMT